jgi:hypothetical protein
VQTAKSLGVKMAAGFDAASAEDQGMRRTGGNGEAGLTPLEVIQAATINTAELWGWPDKVAALEPGRGFDRGRWRSAGGYHGAAACEIGDEGWSGGEGRRSALVASPRARTG